MLRAKSLLLSFSLLLMACPAGKPRLTSVREVARAGGKPVIKQVIDLGALSLPRSGELATNGSDGTLVIGELLLVNGDDFGKQPALVLGGQPCEVLAHITGGGVVVRVPRNVPAGEVTLEVSTRRGRTTKQLQVTRRGVVIVGDQLQRFSLGNDGALALGDKLTLPHVKELLLSPDGAVAYALAEGKLALHVVEMVGELRVTRSDDLPGKRIQTAAASPAGRLAVVTDSHLVVVNTRRPRAAAVYQPIALPRALLDKTMTHAALSMDGRTLALLLAESNQLVLFDLGNPSALPKPDVRDLLPSAKLPRLRAMRFALDGRSLWIVTGDTSASIDAGHQAAEVLTLNVAEGLVVGEPTRATLREAFVPVAAAVGAGEPTPPGTAIRKAIARSSLYLASGSAAVMSKKAAVGKGLVFRVRSGMPFDALVPGDWSPIAVAVAGQPQVLVALAARAKDRMPILLTIPAWARDAKPRIAPLGAVALDQARLFSPGILALQL